jgi:AcrR family transcriptional regulator
VTSIEAPRPDLRADAARNRQRVIQVARGLVDAGDLALPLNAVAKLAGVGVATVYRNFPTRQSLLEAVAAAAFARLAQEVPKFHTEPDPAVALHQLLLFTLDLVEEDRAFAAVLALPSFECPEVLYFAGQLAAGIGDILRRARDAHLIRADIGPDDLRRLVAGIDFALHAGEDSKLHRWRYLEVLLRGLAPSEG